MPKFSVIIPAYNEEHRLPDTLFSVCNFFDTTNESFEILVVDDGSLDATAEVVKAFANDHQQVRLLSYQPNRGKGYAVRTGMLAAHGDLLLLNDADGSSPITEFARLAAGIADGADIAIGSRAKPDSSRIVKALAHRRFMGNTFNLIVQSLLLPGIYDTQCGFKLLKRAAAHNIFAVCCTDGYGMDVEMLYIARLRGYKIAEVAINWSNVAGSKVNELTDSPKMLFEVLKIACSAYLGRYKQRLQN